VPRSMQIPQGILAFLCLFFGVLPLLPVTMVYKAVNRALPVGLCPAFPSLFGKVGAGISIHFGTARVNGVWDPLWFIVASVILAGAVGFLVRAGGAKVRRVETWYGGLEHLPADTSYRGHSFYRPFKQIFTFQFKNIEFRGLYPTSFHLPKISMPAWQRMFLNPDEWFYYPIGRLFMKLTRGISRSHTGHPQMYLLWTAIGVVILIFILLYFPGS